MKNKVQFRVTGKKDKIDGYVEFIVGAFFITGLLSGEPKWSKKELPDGVTQVYVDLKLEDPSLGNLGVSDMPDYDGDLP